MASASALRARRAVEHAATEWHDNGRPPTRLWGGGELAAAVADTGARIRAGSASPPGRRQGAVRWLPRRHRTLVTNRVELSTQAREFLLAGDAEAARSTDLRTALLLGLTAHRLHPTVETHSSLINTLTAGPYLAS
ncbi:MAG: hypothetical protein ACRDRX_06170 [Pseudonocardiaceae bacterium]